MLACLIASAVVYGSVIFTDPDTGVKTITPGMTVYKCQTHKTELDPPMNDALKALKMRAMKNRSLG